MPGPPAVVQKLTPGSERLTLAASEPYMPAVNVTLCDAGGDDRVAADDRQRTVAAGDAEQGTLAVAERDGDVGERRAVT